MRRSQEELCSLGVRQNLDVTARGQHGLICAKVRWGRVGGRLPKGLAHPNTVCSRRNALACKIQIFTDERRRMQTHSVHERKPLSVVRVQLRADWMGADCIEVISMACVALIFAGDARVGSFLRPAAPKPASFLERLEPRRTQNQSIRQPTLEPEKLNCSWTEVGACEAIELVNKQRLGAPGHAHSRGPIAYKPSTQGRLRRFARHGPESAPAVTSRARQHCRDHRARESGPGQAVARPGVERHMQVGGGGSGRNTVARRRTQ